MIINTRSNEHLVRAMKKMHSFVESPDVKHIRQKQENVSGLFVNREISYEDIEIEDIHAEWVSTVEDVKDDCIILYCHGGGYNTGSFRYARSVTNKLAENTGYKVLAFDYRLAPEFPYPCALEDALKVWNYLLSLGYTSDSIVVAGDSAGGNLALSLTLRLKELTMDLPRGLVLFSPWTDLTLEGVSHVERAEMDPILSEEYIISAVEDYAKEEDLKNPLISPLFGNFEGFPPSYIQVGDHEILLSDSEELASCMRAYNVDVKFELYEGMWHVFQMSPLKTGVEAMERVGDYIKELIDK